MKKNKMSKKKKVKKPIYSSEDFDILKAPYYDPYNLHVHIYRKTNNGSYIFPQCPTEKYMSKLKKPFFGSYCIICHHIKIKDMDFNYNNYTDVNSESIMNTSMIDYMSDEEHRLPEEKYVNLEIDVINRWKKIVNKIILNNNKKKKCYTDLFIKDTYCIFVQKNENNKLIKNNGLIENIIYNFTKGKQFYIKEPSLINIRTNNGNLLNIQPDHVFPIYDIWDSKTKTKNNDNVNTILNMMENVKISNDFKPCNIIQKMEILSLNDTDTYEPGNSPLSSPNRYKKLYISLVNSVTDRFNKITKHFANEKFSPINKIPTCVSLLPINKRSQDLQDIWSQLFIYYRQWRYFIVLELKKIILPLSGNIEDIQIYNYIVKKLKTGKNFQEMINEAIIDSNHNLLKQYEMLWFKKVKYSISKKPINRYIWNYKNLLNKNYKFIIKQKKYKRGWVIKNKFIRPNIQNQKRIQFNKVYLKK